MSKLKEHKDYVDIMSEWFMGRKFYVASDVDAVLSEKDKEIYNIKYSRDEWAKACNQKDKEIEELKKKLEDVQASMYCDVVDANMENLILKRALWVTRAAMAKSEKDRWNAHIDCGNRRNRKDPAYVKTGKLLEVSEWRKLWTDIENKCRAKAEEYK